MNLDKVYFEGRIGEILGLADDLKNFKEGNLESMIHARMMNFKEGSFVFIYSLKEKAFSLENENIFKDFKVDLKTQTIKFNYNNKKYFIYSTKEIYKQRWQLDLNQHLQ